MTDLAQSYSLKAVNTAQASENKMHSDDIAQRYGFAGALVPGVDVYAYMNRIMLNHWQQDWLERGCAEVRFLAPVYDGDTITVKTRSGEKDGELIVELDNAATTCATLTAFLMKDDPLSLPKLDDYPETPVPALAERPLADETTLVPGRTLGTLRGHLDADAASAYLSEIGEPDSLCAQQQVVHSGYLLRQANSALKDNVLLGPWIHVSSRMTHFATLQVGRAFEVRSKVVDVYEKKRHAFVDLDVLIARQSGELIAHIAHTAIYRPRTVEKT